MASLPRSRIVTYEEWLTRPEVHDAIEEVVNGEIRIIEAPKWNHSEIIDNLSDLFLRRSQVLMDGIQQPKLFPHVHIDIARIWPD